MRIEIGSKAGLVMLQITDDGGSVEMVMEPDECRELINFLGGALRSIPRARVTI